MPPAEPGRPARRARFFLSPPLRSPQCRFQWQASICRNYYVYLPHSLKSAHRLRRPGRSLASVRQHRNARSPAPLTIPQATLAVSSRRRLAVLAHIFHLFSAIEIPSALTVTTLVGDLSFVISRRNNPRTLGREARERRATTRAGKSEGENHARPVKSNLINDARARTRPIEMAVRDYAPR